MKPAEYGNEELPRLRFDFEEGEKLLNELSLGDGVSSELMSDMTDEIQLTKRQPESILIGGTEGTKTITIFLAPQKVLNGIGPVLIPTFDSDRVVAMVSREFVEAKAETCDSAIDQNVAQEEWDDFLDDFFNTTLKLSEQISCQ